MLDPERSEPGAVRSVTAAGGYPALVLRALVWWQGFSERIPTRCGFSLYRVEYWTTGPAGERTFASGLVALPRAESLRGVVSFQHGTATRRTAAPSTPDPTNGVLAAAVFAGHGHLLVAPDYLGLGSSPGPHPYYHAESTAHAVVDLLRAARAVTDAAGFSWPPTLFLTGFSQGGHATLAAQRALEASPLPGLRVTASAPVAGPFDLAHIGFPSALEGRSRFASLYLGYLTSSYARVYGMDLRSVVREPFAGRLPALFDGSRGGDEVVATLPASPRDFLAPAFLADFDAGRPTWLALRLVENGLTDWTPQAPVRFYYGTRDVDVPPAESIVAAERFAARGADARAVNVGDVDHEGSLVEAIPLVRSWLDELASAGERAAAESAAGAQD